MKLSEVWQAFLEGKAVVNDTGLGKVQSCPFCGSSHLALRTEFSPTLQKNVYRVLCRNCESYGPEAQTTKEAEAQWGQRNGSPGNVCTALKALKHCLAGDTVRCVDAPGDSYVLFEGNFTLYEFIDGVATHKPLDYFDEKKTYVIVEE